MRTELLGLVVVSLILRLYASDANADNSAPVLDNCGMMSLTGISEDDTNSAGNTNGAWQFSTNGGTGWTNFGTPTTSAARLVGADNNNRVRFVPGLQKRMTERM
jgi:hypothetical protein